MDKAILKKFAIESRRELMKKMESKINLFFVNEKFNKNQNGDIIVLSNKNHTLNLNIDEYEKRQMLVKRIEELGLEQVIEESAYTWFNRIVAIRYMEVHDFLPLTNDNMSLGIRVLSSRDDTPNPEIMKFTNLMNPELDINFSKKIYAELKTDNEKFKYILLLVCKKLGKVIPHVFDGVTDYIDILMPDNLLNDTGFVYKIITEIPVENFEQVEIIGWLYQYYISEKKDEVFADLKKNIKIKKENIPSATQIFTPDWIVKYMVENTLGRYTNENFRKKLKYYVRNKDEKVEEKDIEKITFLDPCCGSGHILVYAFEIFYEIYKDNGYNQNEIAGKILNKNIFGLDVDERASQLSILALLLKAREYDKNIFNKDIVKNLNVMSIQEPYDLDTDIKNIKLSETSNSLCNYLIDKLKNAKEIGSLLIIEPKDYSILINEIENDNTIFGYQVKNKISLLIKEATILSNKYDVIVTNPPYMGNRGMDNILSEYVRKNYKNYKTDMFSAFIKQSYQLTKEKGYYALITQPTFLFISSFEKVREEMINKTSIISLLHMGRGIFGIDFGSTSFVLRKDANENYCGSYFRLNKNTFQYIDIKDIESIFLSAKDNLNFKFNFNNYGNKFNDSNIEKFDSDDLEDGLLKIKFETVQSNFNKIPGKPFAYWISDNMLKVFTVGKSLGSVIPIKQGIATADNDAFLRQWFEVDLFKEKLDSKNVDEAKNSRVKWFPYNKGGAFRKWYGNNDYIVNWENDGYEIKNFKDKNGKLRSRPQNLDYCFKKSITWSLISSGSIAFRAKPYGHIFDIAGMSCFPNSNEYGYILGLNNTKIVNVMMKFIAPTLNYQVGDIAKIPIIYNDNKKEKINDFVNQNIEFSKSDWDSFETSWDFKKHPLIAESNWTPQMIANEECNGFMVCDNMEESFNHLEKTCEERFSNLKKNEEELNQIFINIYGLQGELTPEESDKDVTVHKIFENNEDIPEEMKNSQYALTKLDVIKSFISYAVGCMFGRYSLDKDGLIFAGGDFDKIFEKYPGQVLVDDNGQPLPGNPGGWAGVSLADYKYIRFDDKDIKLSYSPDIDNIIPITEDKYFEDDIVEKFVKFVEVVYGKNTLEENLDFIANTLGKRTAETSRDTIRRYFLNDFYADHLKTYQKRPIYWLFDSGKKNGFKALIYMHRYNDQTVSKIRLDYLHKMQQTYATELQDVEYKLNNNPTLNEKKELTKKQADLNAKILETNEYDEKVAHIADQRISIDLDDGVAVNYGKFSVKNPKTGKEESILANSKDIVKKTKNSKEE